MSDMQSIKVTTQAGQEISAVELLIVIAKNKKKVFGLPLVAAIAMVVLSMLMPDIFRASTKLLPPQQSQSGAVALLSQLGGIAGAAAGAAGMKSQSDLFVGMLKSRTIADQIIAKYDLKTVYETKSLEGARRELESKTAITTGKEGLITIEVEDHDRSRAAAIANEYTAQLLDLAKDLAITEAAQRRLFYERQLATTNKNLANAEISLKQALDTGGVVSVDTESRAVLETIARLRAQISAKEIQLRSMEAFVTPSNPEYRRAQEELSSVRQQLVKLENGKSDGVNQATANSSKQQGLHNIKLLRDVKYHQMLLEILAKQYEIARLDEAKEPSLVQVLDKAIEPERKAKPKRFLMVLLATVLAMILGVCWAFVNEAYRKMLATPDGEKKWNELRKYLLRPT